MTDYLADVPKDAPPRGCSCHPSEAPVPCQRRHAYSDCREAARLSRPQQFLAWALGTFGVIALDPDERAARFVEEAIELVHAAGMPQSLVDRIVTRVYSRPPGTFSKEIGQAAVTLEMLAQTYDLCVETEAEREWQRVQRIPREQWTKRHDAKVLLGIANQ